MEGFEPSANRLKDGQITTANGRFCSLIDLKIGLACPRLYPRFRGCFWVIGGTKRGTSRQSSCAHQLGGKSIGSDSRDATAKLITR